MFSFIIYKSLNYFFYNLFLKLDYLYILWTYIHLYPSLHSHIFSNIILLYHINHVLYHVLYLYYSILF